MSHLRLALVLAFVFVLLACGGSNGTAAELEEAKQLTNGDFETADLSGWTADVIDSSWGNWFIYEDGNTAPSTGNRRYSYNVFELPDPPQGMYAAASDSAGAGRYILYQDFTVDSPAVLHLVVYYRSRGSIHVPPHLDVSGSGDRNDQFRVDVIDTAAAIDSLAEGDVFGTLFQNGESDPSYLEPTDVSLDLTPFVGQTVRLRVVQIDNSAAFMSGFDNVRLEPTS